MENSGKKYGSNRKLINILILAAVAVFLLMLALVALIGKPYIKNYEEGFIHDTNTTVILITLITQLCAIITIILNVVQIKTSESGTQSIKGVINAIEDATKIFEVRIDKVISILNENSLPMKYAMLKKVEEDIKIKQELQQKLENPGFFTSWFGGKKGKDNRKQEIIKLQGELLLLYAKRKEIKDNLEKLNNN